MANEAADTFGNGDDPRAGRVLVEHEKRDDDERVSELEGAMSYLEQMVSALIVAADNLGERLVPLLGDTPTDGIAGRLAAADVDTRSIHVRNVSEQAERVRDSTARLDEILRRLDV